MSNTALKADFHTPSLTSAELASRTESKLFNRLMRDHHYLEAYEVTLTAFMNGLVTMGATEKKSNASRCKTGNEVKVADELQAHKSKVEVSYANRLVRWHNQVCRRSLLYATLEQKLNPTVTLWHICLIANFWICFISALILCQTPWFDFKPLRRLPNWFSKAVLISFN